MTPTLQQQAGSEPAAHAARDWVVLLASGEIDAQQMTRFRAWLAEAVEHRTAFEAERRLWADLGALRQPADPATVIPLTRRPPGRKRWRAVAAGLLAACLALVAMFADDARVSLLADYDTAQGEQRQVTLPDGSVVYLNTGTALAVDFSKASRSIELLSGEALFEVAKNPARPFRVRARGGDTQALGTAFVVRVGADDTRVTVTEGVVGVTSGKAGTSVTASAGQTVRYRDGEAPTSARPADLAAATAWHRGTIRIDAMPLDAAIAELDRYVPGRILLLGDPSYRAVGGVFDVDDIDNAVAALAATHGLSVTEITPFLMVVH